MLLYVVGVELSHIIYFPRNQLTFEYSSLLFSTRKNFSFSDCWIASGEFKSQSLWICLEHSTSFEHFFFDYFRLVKRFCENKRANQIKKEFNLHQKVEKTGVNWIFFFFSIAIERRTWCLSRDLFESLLHSNWFNCIDITRIQHKR